MITEFLEISTVCPIGHVFAFLTDASNHPRWDSGSLSMEPVEPGPWRPGLEFRELRRIGPRALELRFRIAGLTVPTSMDIESRTGPRFAGALAPAQCGRPHRPQPGGTMRLSGPRRLLEPLVARAFRRATQRNFVRLTALLDSETTGPPTGE